MIRNILCTVAAHISSHNKEKVRWDEESCTNCWYIYLLYKGNTIWNYLDSFKICVW